MKLLLLLPACLFIFSYGYSQEPNRDGRDVMAFFNSAEGVWEGMPDDTSFISILEYRKGDKEYFVLVNNDLLSKERKRFSHYEGVYFYNPAMSRVEFTTINKNEIHSGYCKIENDTIYHYATIRGKSGKIKAYASAIVKKDKNMLAYYATYGNNEEIPDLKFENPLIYNRVKD